MLIKLINLKQIYHENYTKEISKNKEFDKEVKKKIQDLEYYRSTNDLLTDEIEMNEKKFRLIQTEIEMLVFEEKQKKKKIKKVKTKKKWSLRKSKTPKKSEGNDPNKEKEDLEDESEQSMTLSEKYQKTKAELSKINKINLFIENIDYTLTSKQMTEKMKSINDFLSLKNINEKDKVLSKDLISLSKEIVALEALNQKYEASLNLMNFAAMDMLAGYPELDNPSLDSVLDKKMRKLKMGEKFRNYLVKKFSFKTISKLMNMDNVYKSNLKMKSILGTKKHEFEKKKKILKDKMAKLIKNTTNDLEKFPKYKDYRQKLENLKGVQASIINKKAESLNLVSKIKLLEDQFSDQESGNLEVKNFVIPQSMKSIIQKNIQDRVNFLNKDKPESKLDIHVTSTTIVRELLEYYQDRKLPNFLTKKFDGGHLEELVDKMAEVGRKHEVDIKVKIDELKQQLHLVKIIEETEEEMDKFVGDIFRIITSDMGEYTCIPKNYLSYLIFTMVKTNTIINQPAFFENFFNGMQVERSTSFIVYNYSIFMKKEFMKDLTDQKKLKDDPAAQDLFHSRFTASFIKSYTQLTNIYKTMTRFRMDKTNSEMQTVSLWERVKESYFPQFFYNVATGSLNDYVIYPLMWELVFYWGYKATNSFFNFGIDLIMKGVMFLVWYLIKWYHKEMMFPMVWVVKQITSLTEFKDILPLNFEKYIHQELDELDSMEVDPLVDIDTKIKDVENAFHEPITKNKLKKYNQVESYFVYKYYFSKEDEVFDFYSTMHKNLIDGAKEKVKTVPENSFTPEDIEAEYQDLKDSMQSEPFELYNTLHKYDKDIRYADKAPTLPRIQQVFLEMVDHNDLMLETNITLDDPRYKSELNKNDEVENYLLSKKEQKPENKKDPKSDSNSKNESTDESNVVSKEEEAVEKALNFTKSFLFKMVKETFEYPDHFDLVKSSKEE